MKPFIGYVIILIGTIVSIPAVSAVSGGENIFNDVLFGSISSELSDITNGIVLEAPSATFSSTAMKVLPVSNNSYVYTPWEMIHRTQMLAGFMWNGPIAEFITPTMYIGTPFGDNQEYRGKNNPYAPLFLGDPSSYSECITRKSYLSFGLGKRIESSDIAEFNSIAKICADTFYRDYFPESSTTTREEFLIMMFTLFGEPMDESQQFDSVDTQSSYEIYQKITGINNNGILLDSSIFDTKWVATAEITNSEAIQILALYTAYRMGFQGNRFERGQISMDKLQFNLAFPNKDEVIIRIQ